MAAKLVSMKSTPAEKKEMSEPKEYTGPEYPYGLNVSFNQDSLEKLGIDKLPQVGTEMLLLAKVKVSSASASDSEFGSSKNVSMQITEACLEGLSKDEEKVASKLYDGNAKE
jgi:hypothetical protein